MNSKIVFSPGGHSRWAYRHVESFFYRALTVSVDISMKQSLPKLPLEALFMIEDGKFNPEEIKKILMNIDNYQEQVDIGYDFARRTYRQSYLHKHNRAYNFTREAKKIMFNSFISWLECNLRRSNEG